MSKSITRRAVIAGTVVALLLVTGGYVAAATLSGITVTQTNQNAGSISTPTDTIFASDKVASINITLVQAVAPVCDTNAAWSSASPPTTSNVSVFWDGTAPCVPATDQWFEEVSWIGVHVTGVNQNDTFFITVATSDSGPYTYDNFHVQDITSGDPGFIGQLNVFLAAGSATDGSLPIAYTGISIAVSGT